jgi:hypothetical protein
MSRTLIYAAIGYAVASLAEAWQANESHATGKIGVIGELTKSTRELDGSIAPPTISPNTGNVIGAVVAALILPRFL